MSARYTVCVLTLQMVRVRGGGDVRMPQRRVRARAHGARQRQVAERGRRAAPAAAAHAAPAHAAPCPARLQVRLRTRYVNINAQRMEARW